MARCVIIGCGCRGTELARALRVRGHAVRGTTRDERRLEQLEREGIEAVLGDPDRVATIAGAFEHATLACLLLGSISADPEQASALHSTRLEMLLERMLDTTIRGVVYEARGTLSEAVLEGGSRIVRARCEGSRIPYALLDADPRHFDAWLTAASDAALGLLQARPVH